MQALQLFPAELTKLEQSISKLYKRLAVTERTAEDLWAIEKEKSIPDRGLPKSSYFICFVNRSGSTYLAECLANTKKMGHPQEYFNSEPLHAVERLSKRFEVSGYEGFLENLARRRQTRNGVFGAKISFTQLVYLHEKGFLEKYFPNPKFLMVRRRDLLMQAISWAIAEQTQAWASFQAAKKEPEFDQNAIISKLHQISDNYSRFENYFALCGVEPLHLIYEDVVTNPQASVDAIWRYIGGEGKIEIDTSNMRCQVQRTKRNYEWSGRIRDYINNQH